MGRFTVAPQPASAPGRFSAGRFYVAPEEEPGWLPTASPLVQKRKRPDGTWETRPTPRAGQAPAVTPAQEKGVGETIGDFANRAITASAEGIAALPEILLARNDYSKPKGERVTIPDVYGALTPDAIEGEGGFFDVKTGREDIRRQYEQRKEAFREANMPPPVTASLDTLAEAVGPAEAVGLATVGVRGVARGAGRLLDTSAGIETAFARELAEAAPAARPDRRINSALRQAVEAEIPRVRAMSPEARRALMDSNPGEAVERAIERVEFMEAKGTHAGPPAVGPQVPPQRVRTSEVLETLPPEPPKSLRLVGQGRLGPGEVLEGLPEYAGQTVAVYRWVPDYADDSLRPGDYVSLHPTAHQHLGGKKGKRITAAVPATELEYRQGGEFRWRPEVPVAARVADDLPPGGGLQPREPEISRPGAAGEVSRETFLPRDSNAPGVAAPGAFGSPAEERPFGPGSGELRPVADDITAPRMSTKGIENVAGLQDDLARVAQDNFDEIYAARGPVVPVARWHDAEGLSRKLGLTPDDYLKRPAARGPLSPDEGALGKHYLGYMRQEARALEQRVAAGQVDDLAAAQAELATRNRDVVKMMAVLQGQGSSEAGRYMRMLQEALDPYGLAETPKEKLQLALLKNYGAKNADAAAAIEKRAVAVLRRQAARETRKAARAATAEQLSAEFSSLAANLGDLVKHPKGMGGGPVPLDPELVAVIGKMASNRVRAGVIAVEELVDHVYSAVRQHVGDTISREQVKASIVEHALAKPAKLAPGEARLRRAEASAQKSIERLNASIARGGAAAPGPPPVSSPALDKLRARQAELRNQLADLRRANRPAADPAVRKLKAAEALAARRVAKLEERLATGPKLAPKPAPAASPRLSALRQQAADLKGQILKDPRHGLVQRYRELLDDETVELISKLPDPTENPEALVNFLRQMEKPTFRDFRTTYWLNSILSGTKTMVRNLSGNVAKLGVDTAMRPAGAAVEQFVMAPLQGRTPARLVRETLPATVGVFQGLPAGIKRFAFVIKNGYDPARLVSELTGGGSAAMYREANRLPLSPFMLSEKKWVRGIGVPLTMPSRILEATDALFKTMASSSEGAAWATRTAIQEGAGDVPARVAQLLREQPDEMVQAQVLAAQKATYQDPMSWVGTMASSIRRGPPGAESLAASLRAKGGAGHRLLAGAVQAPATIGQHLIPFIHVSDRVAAGVTDFIPGSKPFKLARLVAEQSPEAADLIARQVAGGALGMLGLAWAADGKLVGAAPKDEKLRNDFYAEGKQPYSLLVGGRWVPVRDVLGPLAGPFVAAAAYHDHTVVGEDPAPALAGMTLSSARYMLDASYMQTLQQVIESVEEENTGDVGRGITSAAARVAGGYVPFSGLQRNVATAADPRVVDKQGFLNELKAGIPGLRQDLPARVGTLGEDLEMSTGAAGGFSPFVPTENKIADPNLQEDVGRLRYSVERRRSEINRVLNQMADARKGKDAARVRELAATLPQPADRVQGDAALDRVRAIEQQIRKLRANDKIAADVKRRREIALQKRMQDILSEALRRMGEAP